MIEKPLDIFRLEPDGSMVWVEAVVDFATGKSRIESISAQRKSEYYIFNVRTGTRTAVAVERRGEAAPEQRAQA